MTNAGLKIVLLYVLYLFIFIKSDKILNVAIKPKITVLVNL